MALSIKNKETEALARELARVRDKPITNALHDAIVRDLKMALLEKPISRDDEVLAELMAISRRAAAIPTINDMTEDEILGYDEFGAPTK